MVEGFVAVQFESGRVAEECADVELAVVNDVVGEADPVAVALAEVDVEAQDEVVGGFCLSGVGVEPAFPDQPPLAGPTEGRVEVGQVSAVEGAVGVFGFGALVKEIEVNRTRLDRNAEKDLALAEAIEAALDLRLEQTEPSVDVAEEETPRDLERLARGHERVRAAVALVHERTRTTRDLCERLLDQPVAPVVVRSALARDREEAIQRRGADDPVAAIVGSDHRQ